MAEPTVSVDELVAQRALLTCRTCGASIWYLDLENASMEADKRIGYDALAVARMSRSLCQRHPQP